jgi:hypothetical protein
VTAALRQSEQERARRLTQQLEGLLAQHSPEAVVTCMARALLECSAPAVQDRKPADGIHPDSPS